MEYKEINESGTEIIQLIFAIPILIVLFGLCAQFFIWATTAVQFANAADYAAYHVDIDTLYDAGIGSTRSEELIANTIAEGLTGVEASNIQVQDVSLTAQQNTESTGSISKREFSLFEADSHGLLSFSATCKVPNIIRSSQSFLIKGTWHRDRLISKTTEVRYDFG